MSEKGSVSLRPTAVEDLPAVTAWERQPENAVFVEVWPHERHLAALTDPTLRHFVVECGDRAVGFVILAGVGGEKPVAEFRRIVVTDKGRGVGQATVKEVVRHAFEDLDASEVWLDFAAHNERAAHVYSKCGFRVDSSAELWAEIAGRPTRLVKMTRTRTA